MHDKIKELAGMALDQALPQTWTTLTAYDLDKFTGVFAELIVRECANRVTRELSVFDIDGDFLLEHFGVE